MNVTVANVTLVDNGMGIMPFIFAPPSLTHEYAYKTAQIQVRGLILNHRFVLFPSCLAFVPTFLTFRIFPECLDRRQQSGF